MAGSSQPQHFFAAGCIFADFAIAVIYYPVIKTSLNFLYIIFRCWHTHILNLNTKINFAYMFTIIRKSSKLRVCPNFWKICNIFQNLLLSNLIPECVNTQIICTKIFIKCLLQDKKWQRLENHQKYILQQKYVVAGKNLPYVNLWLHIIKVS